MYKKQIDDYIKLGHAKLLSKEEISNFSNKTNYIPHHGVVNINKPGTVLVVLNTSMKCDNISLNDKLLPVIDYLNSLIGVLTKFRYGKYAIMGDIEKMFLQVKVIEEYLDALHFIWRDSDQDKISDSLMLSHLFGKKDSPCINNRSLKQSVKNEAKIVFNTYGFQLTKFLSNLPTVLKLLPSSKILSKFVDVDSGSDAGRMLGLIWDINTDKLSFKPVTKIFLETKQGILSMISTIMIHQGFLH